MLLLASLASPEVSPRQVEGSREELLGLSSTLRDLGLLLLPLLRPPRARELLQAGVTMEPSQNGDDLKKESMLKIK